MFGCDNEAKNLASCDVVFCAVCGRDVNNNGVRQCIETQVFRVTVSATTTPYNQPAANYAKQQYRVTYHNQVGGPGTEPVRIFNGFHR